MKFMQNMRNKHEKKIASQRMNLKMEDRRIWKIKKVNTPILKWILFSILLINFFVLKIGLGRGKVSCDSQQFLSKALPECRGCDTLSGNSGKATQKVWLGKPASVFQLRFWLDLTLWKIFLLFWNYQAKGISFVLKYMCFIVSEHLEIQVMKEEKVQM